jgi:hypothetical protein
MKNSTPLLLLFALVALLLCYFGYNSFIKNEESDSVEAPKGELKLEKESTNSKDSEPIFKVGESVYRLKFESDSLDEESRREIAQSLNLVYGHLKIEKHLSSITPNSDGHLSFTGKGRYWPKNLNGFGAFVKSGNEISVLVSEALTKDYFVQKALVENSGTSVSELEAFVAQISKGQLDTEELDKVVALVSIPEGSISNEQLKKQFQALTKGVLRRPSIFEFQNQEINGETSLIAQSVYLDYEGEDVSFAEKMAFIFKQGRWQLVL